MLYLLSKIVGFMTPDKTPASTGDVAYQLLAHAQAGAGRDPYRAQELREAACAYLRVVR
ncbi:MAG: hypothetical protein JWR68_1319 [Polaromonas sp.]|nr:hypothetical protein [Polaromonas sp.]